MWYSIGIFVFTVLVGAVMLTSGKFSNKQKRLEEFLQVKIAEKKAERLEQNIREKQEADYQRRLADANEAEAKADAEAAKAKGKVEANYNPSIQDDARA